MILTYTRPCRDEHGSPDAADPTAAAFFETKYAAASDTDPWRFATDGYEQRRYQTLLGALPRARYRRALEPGCSIGALTVQLAERCDAIVALDFAPSAAAAARRRVPRGAGVEIRCAALPDGLRPQDDRFDLIVLAEIGYYFDGSALARLARDLADRLLPGGDLVAEHWTGVSPDHTLSGETVHDVLTGSLADWPSSGRQRFDGFVIDHWRKPERPR